MRCIAAERLVENGYDKVYNLERGIMEWNLNNLPVVIEPDARPDVENKMEPDEFHALINSEKPVFNRTTTLRDSWAKQHKK